MRPKAILLRSGDVVIMSGASRLAYHGVPKILPPHKGMETPHCLSQDTLQTYLEGAHSEGARLPWCLCGKAQGTVVADSESANTVQCLSCSRLLNSWPEFAAYLSYSRINVNIRQVVSH